MNIPQGYIKNTRSPEGAALGEQLARFADNEFNKLKEKYPNHVERCDTCAFRLGTFANQSAATTMDALKCALEGEEFMCHEKQNEGRVCAGWYVMANRETPIKAPWPLVGGSL